jgi:hypothetical protein
VLVVYYGAAPSVTRLRSTAGPFAGLVPHEVVGIEFRGLEAQPFVLERVPADHAWDLTVVGQRVPADANLVETFLRGLLLSGCEPVSGTAPAEDWPEVRLDTRDGSTVKLLIGPREVVFQRSLIAVDGRVFRVDEDLPTLLDRWETRPQHRDGSTFMAPVPLSLDYREIRAVRVRNPMASCAVSRAQPGPDQDAPDWSIEVNGESRPPNLRAISEWERTVTEVTLRRLALDPVLMEAAEGFAFHLEVHGDSGLFYALEASRRVNADHEHLVRFTHPFTGPPCVIADQEFKNLFPYGTALVAESPLVETGIRDLVRLNYERDGHRCVLALGADSEWELVEPQLDHALEVPLWSEERTTTLFANGLTQLVNLEFLAPDRRGDREWLESVFREPAARMAWMSADGNAGELVVSGRVPGTDYAVLQLPGPRFVVLDRPAILAIMPDVRRFLDPQSVGDADVEW